MTNTHHMSDVEFVDHMSRKLINRGDTDGFRLLELKQRLTSDGTIDPWSEDRAKGKSNPWGPGELQDYVKLRGQTPEPADLEELVDIFLKRNVPRNMHGHLLDNDDNDGQYLRNACFRAVRRWRMQGRREGIAYARRDNG